MKAEERYEHYYNAGYNAGSAKGYEQAIDKACEWLRDNWYKYINIDADGVVCFGHWENDFRKAMGSSYSEKPNNCEKGGEE